MAPRQATRLSPVVLVAMLAAMPLLVTAATTITMSTPSATTIKEGNTGSTAVFTVTAEGSAAGDYTLKVKLGGTAKYDPADATLSDYTITITGGAAPVTALTQVGDTDIYTFPVAAPTAPATTVTRTITIAARADTDATDLPAETIELTLQADIPAAGQSAAYILQNDGVTPAKSTITIDNIPTITLTRTPADGNIKEGSAAPAVYTFTSDTVAPAPDGITVTFTAYETTAAYDPADPTAATNDYTLTPAPGTIATTGLTFPTTPAAADAVASHGTILIPAGSTTATLSITANPDGNADTEVVKIRLVDLANDVYNAPVVTPLTTTIIDVPKITLTRSTTPIAEGGTAVVYTFSRAGGAAGPVTVNFEVAGTAKYTTPAGADDDYTAAVAGGTMSYPNADGATPAAGTLTFSGATATLTITAITDSVSDPGETVSIQLKPPTTADAYIVGTADALVTTITDVEGVSLDIPVTSLHKGSLTKILWTVTRTGSAAALTGVKLNFGPAGANELTPTTEYTLKKDGVDLAIAADAATFDFAAGEASATFEALITETGLAAITADKTIEVTLAADPAYSVVGTAPGPITITQLPLLTFDRVVGEPSTLLEGSPIPTVFSVSSNGALATALPVKLATAGSSAGLVLADDVTAACKAYDLADTLLPGDAPSFTYAPAPGFTMPVGAAKVSLSILAKADEGAADPEDLTLDLATDAGYTFVAGSVLTNINDRPSVKVEAVPATVDEGSSTPVLLTLTRSGDITHLEDGVKFEISGGLPGVDYEIVRVVSGDFTNPVSPVGSTASSALYQFDFAAGVASAGFKLTALVNEAVRGAPLGVKVVYDELSDYTALTTEPTLITINDAPVISLTRSPATIQEGGAPAVYTFSAAAALAADVTVNFAVSGTAAASDYSAALAPNQGGAALDFAARTLTMPAGATSVQLALLATADADAAELKESVALALAPGAGYVVASGSAAAAQTDIVNALAAAFKDVPAAGVNINAGTTASFTVDTPAALDVALSAKLACADGKDSGERQLIAAHPGGAYTFTQAFSARTAATTCTLTATATDAFGGSKSADAKVNLSASGVSTAGATMSIVVNNRVVVSDTPAETEVVATVTLPNARRMRSRRALLADDTLTVKVVWGDGEPDFSQALTAVQGTNTYTVSAKHTYTKTGTWTPEATLLQGGQVVTTATPTTPSSVYVQESVTGPGGKTARVTASGTFNGGAGVLKPHPSSAGLVTIKASTRVSGIQHVTGSFNLKFAPNAGGKKFTAKAKLGAGTLVSVLDKKAIIKGPVDMNDGGAKSSGRFELYLISNGVDGFANGPGARVVLYDSKGAVVFESNEKGKTCSAFDDIAGAARPLTKGKLTLP